MSVGLQYQQRFHKSNSQFWLNPCDCRSAPPSTLACHGEELSRGEDVSAKAQVWLPRTGKVVLSAGSDGRIPVPGEPLLCEIKAVSFILIISAIRSLIGIRKISRGM